MIPNLSPRQIEYEQKIQELKNAPKFRKYIVELLEYAEQKQLEPKLTWTKFKKRKYNNNYESKKGN